MTKLNVVHLLRLGPIGGMVFLFAACTSSVRREIVSAPATPSASTMQQVPPPRQIPSKPEGGMLTSAQVQVHDIPELAWSIAEQQAAFALARQASSDFLGAVMVNMQEKPTRAVGDDEIFNFVSNWRGTIALQRVKAPNLSYERLFAYDRHYTDNNGREMVEVFVQANERQVKLMRLSWARLLHKEAMASGVLKGAEKEFWNTLKELAESPMSGDVETTDQGRTP